MILFINGCQFERELLPASLLEELKNQPQNQQMLCSLLEEIELLVDSTEQARQRPKNYLKPQRKGQPIFRIYGATNLIVAKANSL